MKQLCSDHYWRVVETEEDYKLFLKSGMHWEIEPHLPETWAEHCRLKTIWEEHKAYDGT